MRLCLIFLMGGAAFAQETRVTLDSLLNLQFYPGEGNFRMEELGVLSPPAGNTKGKVTLSKGGRVVGSTDIYCEPRPENNFKDVGWAKSAPTSPGGFFKSAGPGDYVMTVELGGKSIGSYGFKMEAGNGGLRRVGPWSKTAVLRRTIGRTGEPIRVGIWLNIADLPGFQPGKQTKYTAQILQGGKEIGFVEGVASDEDWTYYTLKLVKGTRFANGPFQWEDLVKTPGAYSFAIRVNGAIAKEYKFQVAGGAIARLPQKELTPMAISDNQGNLMREEHYWLAPLQ